MAMEFAQASVDVRLFALGFLSAHDIDTLQLVDRRLCTLVEAHRRHHLARHAIEISISIRGMEFGTLCSPRKVCSSELDNPKATSIWLDPSRISCVHKLSIVTSVPYRSAERKLIARLKAKRIPVTTIVTGCSTTRLPTIQSVSRLIGVRCVEVVGEDSSFMLACRTLYCGVPRFVYKPLGWHSPDTTTIHAVQLLLDEDFTGRAMFHHLKYDTEALSSIAVVTKLFVKGQLLPGGVATETADRRINREWRKDLLVVYQSYWEREVQEDVEVAAWSGILGAPIEGGVCMPEERSAWWREVLANGDPSCRLFHTEYCKWTAWRVQSNFPSLGVHLRVMKTRLAQCKHCSSHGMAVHFQLIDGRVP